MAVRCKAFSRVCPASALSPNSYRYAFLLCGALLGWLMFSQCALAVTDTEVGANGANGVSGAPLADQDGTPGNDALPTGATAISSNPSNSARATAGQGGGGGSGSDGNDQHRNGKGERGGQGGDATATANTTPGASSADATAVAFGGTGGGGGSAGNGNPIRAAGGDGLAGGSATASAQGANTNSQSVNLTAEAHGGSGGGAGNATYNPYGMTLSGRGGDGGTASLGTVYGTSSGSGPVTVNGFVYGGSGGVGNNNLYFAPQDGHGGNGAAEILSNAVDGDTSGNLSLVQEVHGGSGGNAALGLPGIAGDATSSLVVSKSDANLALTARAFGGSGGAAETAWPTAPQPTHHATVGATGTAYAEGINASGGIQISASSRGGGGANDIFGGSNGGFSQSTGVGTTFGSANTNVSVSAIGGDPGGANEPISGPPTLANHGKGGDALALATGTADSAGRVDVESSAAGGEGGAVFGSHLMNDIGTFGAAVAHATGIGGHAGHARATATTLRGLRLGSGVFADVSSSASGQPDGRVDIEARANVADAPALLSATAGLQGAAFVAAAPTPGNVAASAAGHSNLLAAGLADEDSVTLGLGVVGGRGQVGGSGAARTTLSTIAVSSNTALSQFQTLGSIDVGLVDSISTGAGFDSLRLLVTAVNVSTIVDQTFSSLAVAQSYFHDHVLHIANFGDTGFTDDFQIRVELDVTTHSPLDSFFASLVVGGAAGSGPHTAVPLVGDYDRDGDVDWDDYNVWRSTFGSHTQLAADGNGDGIVNAADYTIWRDHLTQTGSGIGNAAAAPEPPAFYLALIGLACISTRNRRA